MTERFPGYDVLSKRHTASWNEITRQVIDERLAIDAERHAYFSDAEWATLRAVCDRIVPQPPERERVIPVAALVDQKLAAGDDDGYRDARLPPMGEAWRMGLAALEAEAAARYAKAFDQLTAKQQDILLTAVQDGAAAHPAWGAMRPAAFFAKRVLQDVLSAYYGHPTAWNEIGFGGPASPRGYVRMNYDRRDPWEAAEAKPGASAKATRENVRVGRT